jgi:GNAT superfamily N-acetyltransferase
VTQLIGAFDAHFLGKPELSERDLLDDWRELDLAEDAWLVELDGRLAGYVALHTTPHRYVDGYVHPEAWGRGVGSRLLDLAETEARRRGIGTLPNAVLGDDEGAHQLLQSRGYRPVRHFYRMTIDLDRPPPHPVWPDGLFAVPVDYSRDAGALHAALDEAFVEEWGHEPESEVDWRARRERAGFDPTLWFVVKDGDEVAAAIISDEERFGTGWIATLGVRKPWRRRGLGLALLLHAFGELYGRGQRRIGLGVDAQNPTGATRLYQRAGMKVAWSATFFEKELAP